MIRLVAFLGNYGREYERTRHNAAWQFADALPFAGRLGWQEKFHGSYAAAERAALREAFVECGLLPASGGGLPRSADGAERVFFLKPETYMNLSGQSVGALADFFKIAPEEILVVHDELELPLGTVGLKWSGGLGGHNGLRSVKASLGTADFWRLRFGISKPSGADIAEYVLSPFLPDERIVLSQVFPQAAALLAKALVSADAARLLPEWRKKKLSAD
ncbi:MAG: aminoacyl-tRNA hydrolase [Treponemataceae bacterium]|nr:aminoacyl-tRNA hydrolase [Treponemataceae bacterium]